MTPSLLLCCALLAAPIETAHRRVVTVDGASLALYRYRASGTGTPVLLLADLGFGRALVDPLARALVVAGHVVYVAELRGQGASSAGSSLRSWVHLDLPAIAEQLAREHPGPLDLVAHGWAGSLAMAATTRELPVRRVVALNTPFTAEPPTRELETFVARGGHFATFASSPEGAASFERLFVMGSPIAPERVEALRVHARDLSPGLACEWLAWLRTGDLPLDDGSTVRGRLTQYDRPTLLLLGLANNVAGPELCGPLRTQTHAPVTVRTFSRFDVGDDFSHVTLLAGSNAARLVFPRIIDFLSVAPSASGTWPPAEGGLP